MFVTFLWRQVEEELKEIRDVSEMLRLLRVTADTLALVGGTSGDSLHATITRLKLVPAKAHLPKALRALKLGHLEQLMIRYYKSNVAEPSYHFDPAPEPFYFFRGSGSLPASCIGQLGWPTGQT